jgi:ABC-2 type transport system ATP-binding protein
MTPPPAVRTAALTHRFGELTALDHVDLEVEPGEIYGFLGRNGAGKTTLIRALLGLITPSAGTVEVLGTRVRGGRTAPGLWAEVGYLVEGPGLYPSLTVLDHLQLAARYRGLSPGSVGAAVEQLDLGRYEHVRARSLSLGNRQRLGLALALLHRPQLVILDEPVNGLDPAGVVDVRNLLRRLADEGVTVFMSTHLITEVARLADRVGIIHRGRLIAEVSGERLHSSGDERLVSTFRNAELARRGAAALSAYGLEARAHEATVVSTVADALRCPDRVAALLVEAGAPPTSLGVEREDLERYFLRLTEEVAS